MFNKFFKITVFLVSFILLTGFIPLLSLLGPGVTGITSGNLYKAGTQMLINKTVKNKTGKHSLEIVKEKIDKRNNKKNFDKELKELIEKRIQIARNKLGLNNFNQ